MLTRRKQSAIWKYLSFDDESDSLGLSNRLGRTSAHCEPKRSGHMTVRSVMRHRIPNKGVHSLRCFAAVFFRERARPLSSCPLPVFLPYERRPTPCILLANGPVRKRTQRMVQETDGTFRTRHGLFSPAESAPCAGACSDRAETFAPISHRFSESVHAKSRR